MKKLTTIILISCALLAGCGGNTHQKMGGGTGIAISPDKLAVKVDPVCGMKMDQSPIADTMTYQGKLYGFCSTGCKEAFAADPEKALADMAK